jgi:hypothetical protein
MFNRWLTGAPYAPAYQVALADLETIKGDRKAAGDGDDDIFKRMTLAASMFIVGECRRMFSPFKATRLQDWKSPTRLQLDEDLLEITSITDSTGAFSASDYTTMPRNATPYNIIEAVGNRQFTYSTKRQGAIIVVGTWGFHPNAASMWVDTTTINMVGNLNNSEKSITLTDVDDVKTLSIIRTESEWMLVTDRNTTTKVITVRKRGDFGTSAAAHDNSTAVYVYSVPEDIRQSIIGLCLYLYEVRDNYGTQFGSVDGIIEVAKSAPAYIYDSALKYKVQR